MTESGTLLCPLCNRPVVRMEGKIAPHRFAIDDLQGEEICIDCARRVLPERVAAAEALERALPDEPTP